MGDDEDEDGNCGRGEQQPQEQTRQAAQLGRPNVVRDVSERMVGQFADCIRAQLEASPEEAAAAVKRAAKPLSGFRLALLALVGSLKRLFRRGGGERGVEG